MHLGVRAESANGWEKIMNEKLDDMLNPSGPVVLVREDGTFAEHKPAALREYPPEIIYCEYSGPFAEAQISDDQERDMVAEVKRDGGWDVLTGWAMGGGLAIMHTSQYVGGRLAEHILETPGLWSCVAVDIMPPTCEVGESGMPCADFEAREECAHVEGPRESAGVGWALVHREV